MLRGTVHAAPPERLRQSFERTHRQGRRCVLAGQHRLDRRRLWGRVADADPGDLTERYPKAQVRDFDGNPDMVSEMDALIAYLQMLGTLVDVNSAAAQQELAEETGR